MESTCQNQVSTCTLLGYAIEVCPTNKSDVLPLEYIVDTCFRKIFNVKSKDIMHECETEFGVFSITDAIDRRKSEFLVDVKYNLSDNFLCHFPPPK